MDSAKSENQEDHSGTRFRYSPQATFYTGPFGLLAEYVNSSQEVINGTNEAKIENHAWNLTAHFVISGEQAGYKGVSPKNPFDLDSGKLGAWEIAFRYSQLNIDDDAFPIFADPSTAASQAKELGGWSQLVSQQNCKIRFQLRQYNF